jgi:hypothetical protein
MDSEINEVKDKRLIEIGAIFYNLGIDSIERAIKLRDHFENCEGGKECLLKLLNEEK